MSKRLKAKGGKTCRMQNTLNQIPVFCAVFGADWQQASFMIYSD